MEICAPMETDCPHGDPMETEVEGRRNGHFGDSDSESDWAAWKRTQFWYEVRGLRKIPDYSVSCYPWEEEKDEKDAGGREGEEEDRKGLYFLEVTDRSWLHSPYRERKRGRWDMKKRMLRRKGTASPPYPEEMFDAEPSFVYTSTEVLKVRMEMHECFEEGVSWRRLFKSDANKEELRLQNVDEPYLFYISRCQHESAVLSYAHVFPKLHDVDPLISCEWVRPTTLEGDRQYLNFFHKLKELTKYGQSKDHVMAQAIVLARKHFTKLLYFQIDVAVQDLMQLMENEERMQQRYNLYYFAVTEIVLNGKNCKAVLNSIRDGESGLPYDLTEFSSNNTDFWNGLIVDMVSHLANHLCAKGLYNEWVFDTVDKQVAQVVCDTVHEQLGFHSNLYVDFLSKKMAIAEGFGLLSPEDIDLNDLREGP